MKSNKPHIAKRFFLLLLSLVILTSSVGLCNVSHNVVAPQAKEAKGKKEGNKEESLSVAYGLEAVVVSLLTPDFEQEVVFNFFDFPPVIKISYQSINRVVYANKHFHTLFTNIISPNAP